MNGYTIAVWSVLILAELLAISVALNIFGLRRQWLSQFSAPSQALIELVQGFAAKAHAIQEVYRRFSDGSVMAAPALLATLPSQEQELEVLLQSMLDGMTTESHAPHTILLEPLYKDLRDSHALLKHATGELLGKANLLHDLRERTRAVEQLLQELTELSANHQRGLKGLVDELIERQSIPEALQHLNQRYQLLQETLAQLQSRNEDLLAQETPYRSFSEQCRSLFETLHTLRLDNLRLVERVRTQEPQMDCLSQEKTHLQNEVERLMGFEEAHRTSQGQMKHLETQLEQSQEEVRALQSEMSALTVEYLKLFEAKDPKL
jgi:uncharacterized protein YoxC